MRTWSLLRLVHFAGVLKSLHQTVQLTLILYFSRREKSPLLKGTQKSLYKSVQLTQMLNFSRGIDMANIVGANFLLLPNPKRISNQDFKDTEHPMGMKDITSVYPWASQFPNTVRKLFRFWTQESGPLMTTWITTRHSSNICFPWLMGFKAVKFLRLRGAIFLPPQLTSLSKFLMLVVIIGSLRLIDKSKFMILYTCIKVPVPLPNIYWAAWVAPTHL